MRKVLALFLAATLLCVSSVPALVEAASCVGPELAVMMMDEGHAMHHDGGVEDTHLGHDHTAGFSADWQKDRIECGCGCHRSVDALPHLLAPHTPAIFSFEAGVDSVVVTAQPEAMLLSAAAKIPSPPPQSIS